MLWYYVAVAAANATTDAAGATISAQPTVAAEPAGHATDTARIAASIFNGGFERATFLCGPRDRGVAKHLGTLSHIHPMHADEILRVLVEGLAKRGLVTRAQRDETLGRTAGSGNVVDVSKATDCPPFPSGSPKTLGVPSRAQFLQFVAALEAWVVDIAPPSSAPS